MSVVPYKAPTLVELQDVAKAFAASGYFKDATDVAKAYTKVLAGNELGIPPMQAMTGIHIVEGKPTLSATLVGALIKRSGRYDYRVRTLTDQECVLEFFQNGEPVGESTFTMADARQAGVGGRGAWKSYPRNMLLARALTNGARFYCPDVFGGAIYTAEELGAPVDEQGEVVLEALPATRISSDEGAVSRSGGSALPAGGGSDEQAQGTAAPIPASTIDVDALELAPEAQIQAFAGLIAAIAEADPDPKHNGQWWSELADKAAEREYQRKVARLTGDELGKLTVQFQEHYGKLKGSGGETPVPPSPDSVEPAARGSAAPPEQTSAGNPAGIGESAVEATDAPAEPLFKAPTGPRGSKRQHKDVAA